VELNINIINENMNAILFGLVEPSWFKDVPDDIGMYYRSTIFKKIISLLILFI